MPVTWDEAPQKSSGKIVWDDEKSNSLADAGTSFLEGAKGTGAAAVDLAAGMLKFPASIALAGIDTAMGERPDIARTSAQQAMEETFPSVGPKLGVEENIGYKAPMYPFEKLSEGIEWLGNKFSDDPSKQGVVKQLLDVGTFALPFLGSRAFKAGKDIALSDEVKPIPRINEPEIRGNYEIIRDEQGNISTVTDKTSGKTFNYKAEPKIPTGEVLVNRFEKQREPVPAKQTPELVSIDEATWRSSPVEFGGKKEPPLKSKEQLELEAAEEAVRQKLEHREVFEKRQPPASTEPLEFSKADRITWEPTVIEKASPGIASGLAPKEVSKYNLTGARMGEKRGITNVPMSDIRENPNLLQEPKMDIPNTLDILTPMMEARAIPIEKTMSNRTLASLSKRVDEQSKYIEEMLDKKEPVAEIQKEIDNWSELVTRAELKVDEIERNAVRGTPLENTLKKTYPEATQHPFGKKQGGAIYPKEISEGFKKIKDYWTTRLAPRLKYGWDEAMRPPTTFQEKNAGGLDTLKRGYEAFKEGPEPQVYRSPRNKQSGMIDPKVFIEGIRKSSKSVEEFTKKLVDELGEEFRPLATTLYKKERETPRVEPVTKEPEVNVLPKKMQQYMLADNRTADKFVAEEAAKGFDKMEDMKPWAELSEVMPLSIVAARAKKSPVINWVWNNITKLDNELFIKKETAKYGTEFGVDWRGFKKHIKSDDGAMTILESLPKKRQEEVMNTFFEKFENKDVPVNMEVLKGEGLSEKEAKGILAARNWMDTFVKDYNAWAKEVGELEIVPRPNYLPHIWKGDYRVFVYRMEEGEKVLVRAKAASTIYEAKTIAKDLKEQFPEYEISAPVLAKSKYNTSDIQAYKDAIEFLEKDDPARRILDKTFNEILAKRGFRKSTLFRKGTEGFDTDINIIGDYLDKGYNFLYNQKKKAAYAEINSKLKEAGLDLSKDRPNTHKYLLDAVAESTHSLKDQIPLITSIVDSVGVGMGIGPKGVQKAIKTFNGWASATYLTTPVFLSVQALQTGFNTPKAVQLNKGPVDITMAYGEAYRASVDPSTYHKEAMNWAVENGYIQSRIANLADLRTDNPRTWGAKAPAWWMNKIIGKADSQLARVPSFFFYDTLLKKDIPNKAERWHQAGMMANEIMVNYSPSNTPLIFGRLGETIGPAVRPFTQFPLSYFGQMLTYMGDIKAKHTVAPLATFLAVQAILGGVTGFIGIPDANKVVDGINKMFGYSIPNVEEILAKSDVGNTVMFGPVSTITGLNISGTTSAPSLLNPPAMPGVGYATDLASQGFNVANKGIKGELTEADKMIAAQKVLPKLFQGAVEDYFTKPGRGVPNPYNSMEPDLPPREPGALGGLVRKDDWSKLSDRAARYMGSRSPEEARERLKVKASKKHDQKYKERRGAYIKLMVDRIDEGKDIEDILPNYMKYDGNPETLVKELVSGLIDRNKTYAERYVGNMKGLSGAQRIQRLKEFKLLIEKEPLEKQIETLREIKK